MVTKKNIEAVLVIGKVVVEVLRRPEIRDALKTLKNTGSQAIKNLKKKIPKKKSVKKPAKKVKAKRSKKK